MESNMKLLNKYRKFIVAAAGVVVLIVGREAGLDSNIYAYVVSGLTALGVYGVPNA